MKTIALVTCVAEKRKTALPAKDLYTGPLFENFMETANHASPDEIYILSGKHHLLELADIIEPYDVNLNLVPEHELKIWAEIVVEQLATKCDLENDHFVLIANPTYLKYIVPEITHYSIGMAVL